MAILTTGRKVSITGQARRALRNAKTRAAAKQTAEEANVTLLAGIATAESWLDRTHPKLARP